MTRRQSLVTMEITVSSILRAGVAISASVILLGLVLFIFRTPQPATFHTLIEMGTPFPHTIPEMASSLASGEGIGFIELGVLLLILTPIFRVSASIILFLRNKETAMTIVTISVLTLLLSSFVIGLLVK